MWDSITDDVYAKLKYCPICGEELEDHPLGEARSCFAHGDFVKRWHNQPDRIIVFKGMKL